MSQTRIYVGGLNPKCRESDLERFFAGYGHIKSILLKRGYGFVEFEDSYDAKDAVENLNGLDLIGYRVEVAHATPRSFRRLPTFRGRGRGRGSFSRGRGSFGYNPRQIKRGAGYRVIVKNVPNRISWQDLKDFMRQAGEVSYADVSGDLNEGIVEYRFYADLRRALETLDNTELGGWKVRLIEENRGSAGGYSRSNRNGSGSGRSYRDNSRSLSRSRSLTKSRSRSPVRSSRKR